MGEFLTGNRPVTLDDVQRGINAARCSTDLSVKYTDMLIKSHVKGLYTYFSQHFLAYFLDDPL